MQDSFLGLLRQNPNYRRLMCAGAVSLFGDWFNVIAAFALIYELRGPDASLMGAVLIVKHLPILLVSPLAGLLADRFNKKAIMIASDILRALIVLALLLAPQFDSLSYVFVLLALQSVFLAFFEPARSAVTPMVVEGKNLLTANTLGSMMWSSMMMIGSFLGGVVTERFDWQTAMSVDAFSYLFSAYFISRIDLGTCSTEAVTGHVSHSRAKETYRDFIEYLRGDKRVCQLMLIKGVYGIGGAMILMLTVFGQQVYSLGERGVFGVSLLYFARGVGALLGPLVARQYTRGDPPIVRSMLFKGFIGISFTYICFGLSTHILLAAIFITLTHMIASVIWVYSNLLLQLSVEDRYRGRVFGLELGLFTLTFSASTIFYGYAIDHQILTPASAAVIIGASWLLAAAWWRSVQYLWKA